MARARSGHDEHIQHGALVPRAGGQHVFMLIAGITVVLGLTSAYWIMDRERHPRVWDVVDVDTEMNLPTWWNVVLLLAVGVGAAVAARCIHAERLGWIAVSATAVVVSLDEGAHLHESAGALANAAGLTLPTVAWVVVGAVVSPVGLLVLSLLTRSLPGATRRGVGRGHPGLHPRRSGTRGDLGADVRGRPVGRTWRRCWRCCPARGRCASSCSACCRCGS